MEAVNRSYAREMNERFGYLAVRRFVFGYKRAREAQERPLTAFCPGQPRKARPPPPRPAGGRLAQTRRARPKEGRGRSQAQGCFGRGLVHCEA